MEDTRETKYLGKGGQERKTSRKRESESERERERERDDKKERIAVLI